MKGIFQQVSLVRVGQNSAGQKTHGTEDGEGLPQFPVSLDQAQGGLFPGNPFLPVQNSGDALINEEAYYQEIIRTMDEFQIC